MDHPASADSRLSNYRLERLLGSGGMGAVYLARDLALDRPVAIKFIAAEKAGDDSARRRLIREARAAAALDHPHICGVHEVIDAPDGRACIVMQYVEGRTLADTLRDGPLDVRLALTITADLASALAAAHRHGLIHRDLKPQNIILTPDNRAKLLDFGVARRTDASTIAGDDTTTTQLTTPGAIVGTPPYMSPEQVLQRPLDGRSDLFALGAVLFECLTGRRPFEGGSPLAQVGEVLHRDPPPVSSLRSGLTDQHDALVRRLLAKAPEDRFRSADEVLGALRVLLPDESSGRWRELDRHQQSWGFTPRVRRIAYIALAAGLIVAAAGIWRWSRPAPTFEGTPQAKDSYEVGTEWIRRGAYASGRRALTEAVNASPGYVPAYVRLAEASSELDDYVAAREALLTVDDLLADVRDLAVDDRLRLDGVRSLVLRKLGDAVRAFEELTRRHPKDAGVLLDLGRMQETAGLLNDATRTYQQVLVLNPSYATAHLRLARTLADQSDRAALVSFDRAQALYVAESNFEGQVETMLRRGSFLDALGDLTAARHSLEFALHLAEQIKHPEQAVRARLALSSVTASEGRFRDAQELAANAVQNAADSNLNTIAADGLIDLANVLLYRQYRDASTEERLQAIESHLARASSLAEQREARRIRARAALQLAAVKAQWGERKEALEIAENQLPFLRDNGYRRFELQARLIMARAHEGLGHEDEARRLANEVLTNSKQMGDASQEARALEILAAQASSFGELPEAERFMKRTETIHRQQSDNSLLPYDLTNRAELLIRLGRYSEADDLLDEVQRGIDQKLDSFVSRSRRLKSLRALEASTRLRLEEARRIAREIITEPPGEGDSAGRLCRGLLYFATAKQRTRYGEVPHPNGPADLSSASARESRYWELRGRLSAGAYSEATDQAVQTLKSTDATRSPEYEWRIAAIGAAAAAAAGDSASARDLNARATAALHRLRVSWKEASDSYERRPDLAEILPTVETRPQR